MPSAVSKVFSSLHKEKQPKDNGFFLTGPQNFEYDFSKPVFEKRNGLLFRLVNTKEKRWAYYNDTKKYEFHITVTFGPNSTNLVALGKTSLAPLPEGGWVATNVVYPNKTEPFVEGDICGFDARVSALLLTVEYMERHKKEKEEAKKAAKAAKKAAKSGSAAVAEDEGELNEAHERS